MRKFLLTLISLVMLTACEHKELCFHHDHRQTVRIEFDWRYAPESPRPLMQVWLYSEDVDDEAPMSFIINGVDGGEIVVPEGYYTLIAHPAEMESNRVNTGSAASLHILTTRAAGADELLFGASTAPENLILEPEPAWIANARNVNVKHSGVDYECVPFSEEMVAEFTPVASKEQKITLFPYDPMSYYSLEVRNVNLNVEPSGVAGALDGLSQGLYALSGESHSSAVAIPFECRYDREAHTFRAEFVTFGRHSQAATPHMLSLYLLTRDSRLYRLSSPDDAKFNLSSQVTSAPDPRHVHLVVDGVTLQAEQPSSGGNAPFGATASEYQEVNTTITF